jgi:hypothetical protein
MSCSVILCSVSDLNAHHRKSLAWYGGPEEICSGHMYGLSVLHVRCAIMEISCHDCYYNLSGIVLDQGTKANRCKKFEDSTVRFESPFSVTVMRLIDLFVAADSTPLGDQDILYLKGFSAATGSGSPPHRDTSSVTLPPLS